MSETKTTLDKQQAAAAVSGTDKLVSARQETLKNISENNSKKGFEWLNEHSRNFLGSGYLTEGVTAEQRIREIADRAEQILKKPAFQISSMDI